MMYIMKISHWEHPDKIGGEISIGHFIDDRCCDSCLKPVYYEDGCFNWSQYKFNKDEQNGYPSHEWMAMEKAKEFREGLVFL